MADEMTFGERMRRKRFGGLLKGGRSRTERVTSEGHLATGEAYKVTTDELGNKVRERSTSRGVSTGQDVKIAAPCLSGSLGVREER